jgi:hypothetical protein
LVFQCKENGIKHGLLTAIGKQGRFGTADDPTNQDRWMSDLGRIALTKSEGTDANKGRP